MFLSEIELQLRALYPQPEVPRILPVVQVRSALKSFPTGSGAGPSGLREQHLLDAFDSSLKDDILEVLAHFPPIKHVTSFAVRV